MKAPNEKVDKYERILAKYDWHAPRPPRGYQYGVGRGAKPFVTSAELTVGLPGLVKKTTAEENDLFVALERLERHHQKEKKGKKEDPDAMANNHSSASGTTKLSLEDLSTVDSSGVGSSLMVRSARTEAVDAAEEYFFSDENRITVHDLLHGKNTATQHNLQNILEMGSPEEQSTWITHARAYREMGMHKKAHQTLIEGCARTGRQGSLIWEERLSYLPKDDHAARRRLLEEATEAFPGADALWLELLTYHAPHEQLEWVQRAVIACPRSEALWLRLVAHVSNPQDQKKVLQKALQHTPHLPLLWSKLARLESYTMGLDIFRAAAQRYASLELLIEAAKFVEWSAIENRVQTSIPHSGRDDPAAVEDVSGFGEATLGEIEKLVRVAAQHYLSISEDSSRRRWLGKATELCGDGTVDGRRVAKDPSTGFLYLWTAAYMFLYAVLPVRGVELGRPRHESSSSSADTYLLDILALLESPWEQHELLCALWAGWLLLQKSEESRKAAGTVPPLPNEDEKIGNEKPSNQASDKTKVLSNLAEAMSVIRAAIETAPREILNSVSELLTSGQPQGVLSNAERGEGTVVTAEEEESQEPVREDVSVGDTSVKRRVSNELRARVPLIAVLLPMLSNADYLTHVELLLTIADAFYKRAYYHVVLHILKRAQMSAQECAVPSMLIVCAIAKAYAALGLNDHADACLLQATVTNPHASCGATTGVGSGGVKDDLVWVKLAVHRRSRGQEITALLEEGIQRVPSSPRLWLMRLEEMRKTVLDAKASTKDSIIPSDLIMQMRKLYTKALSTEHCYREVSVWIYAAVRIESELFFSAATARALLLDAAVATGAADSRHSSSSLRAKSGGFLRNNIAEATAALGLARASVERLHVGDAAALEVVKETLQKLPKTGDGTFTIPVGELLHLYIDLEPPSSRGRSAACVMKQWKSREGLALVSVAKLYHQVGDHQKALNQALKAVEAGNGRCGDAIALLWRLAQLPDYQALVGQRLEGAEWKPGKELSPERIQRWVWGVAAAAASSAERHERKTFLAATKLGESMNPIENDQELPLIRPNCGPLWIDVSKASDPSNVTLTGYRESVETMLRVVMQRVLP
ncbi:unnamed protein product [Phytomonas sp. EM1]|nr:unnamed protein product [Phytomonas sp. EM1]|eukprot:CCW60395.1 unnamed protein product [Phytomonas sp. isolate EM1]